MSLQDRGAIVTGAAVSGMRCSNITSQDIADEVVFLCSDSAEYISGSILPYLFR